MTEYASGGVFEHTLAGMGAGRQWRGKEVIVNENPKLSVERTIRYFSNEKSK